jgi:hypothetical protein
MPTDAARSSREKLDVVGERGYVGSVASGRRSGVSVNTGKQHR